MRKIYHLGTCSTCARIIDELGLKKKKFVFQDIRTEKITPAQLKEMKDMAGSYEALFSRVALKYRAMKLNERTLSESEMKALILQEDTFLKRPVIIIGDQIFIGNTKKNIEAASKAL
jgi:arsenate reductase